MEKSMKKRERHSFPVRQMNISDSNWEWLKSIKVGTWDNTFNMLLNVCEKYYMKGGTWNQLISQMKEIYENLKKGHI